MAFSGGTVRPYGPTNERKLHDASSKVTVCFGIVMTLGAGMKGSGLMASSMAADPSLMLTVPRELLPNATILQSLMRSRYVGEYSKNVKHGQGREQQPNGQYDLLFARLIREFL